VQGGNKSNPTDATAKRANHTCLKFTKIKGPGKGNQLASWGRSKIASGTLAGTQVGVGSFDN